MKKLLFLSLFLLCCSNSFSYQDVKTYDLSLTVKDPYTLSKDGDKTTIRHKDIVISVIHLDADLQSSSAYANAIATRLLDKDMKISVIEQKVNKNNIKYTYFTSSDSEIDTAYMVIKQAGEQGYIVACNKKEYDKDNLCQVMIDSVRVK